jgi:hypothetical protein
MFLNFEWPAMGAKSYVFVERAGFLTPHARARHLPMRGFEMTLSPSPSGNVAHKAIASGAAAAGALAIGAMALGALAIGVVAIGRLTIRRVRLGEVEIDRLIVRRMDGGD